MYDGSISSSEGGLNLSSYPTNYSYGMDISQIKVDETHMRRSNTGTITSTNISIHIWHFKGDESYHAMHEIFFSPHALYIVTWKLSSFDMKIEDDINDNIQYWIDLIQARAPGAMILIVATHADRLRPTDVEDKIMSAYQQLERNASERIKMLEQRMHSIQDSDTKRSLEDLIGERRRWKCEIIPVNCLEDMGKSTSAIPGLGAIEASRYPSSDSDARAFTPLRLTSNESAISSFSSVSESAHDALMRYMTPDMTPTGSVKYRQPLIPSAPTAHSSPSISSPPPPPKIDDSYLNRRSMLRLRDRILELATPTEENPHPFGNLGYDVPSYYEDVRIMLRSMRASQQFCSIEQLMEDLSSFPIVDNLGVDDETRQDVSLTAERIRNALSYFSSIGEIFWIEGDHAETKPRKGSSFDISRIIFLDPKYLMFKVTCIVQLHLDRNLEDKNGVVTWGDLLRILTTKDAASSLANTADSSTLMITTLNIDAKAIDDTANTKLASDIHVYLRGLLEYYGFIIPIRQASSNNTISPTHHMLSMMSATSSSDQVVTAHHIAFLNADFQTSVASPSRPRSGSTSGTDDVAIFQRPYLMPSLLSAEDSSLYEYESITAGAAQTSFQRCFRFEHFTPPGLLHKVLAKVYAYTQLNKYIHTRSVTKNSFLLKFKYHSVYVRMIIQSDFNRSTISVSKLNILEINAFGFIFHSNEMLEKMDIICAIVKGVLDDIPGLSSLVDEITFCPSCRTEVSKQHSTKSVVGEFKYHDLHELKRELERAKSSDLELRAWRSRFRSCPADPHCRVQPELLIHIPVQTKKRLEEIQRTDHIFQYLLEDMVASSSTFHSHLMDNIPVSSSTSSTDVRRAVVKVATIAPVNRAVSTTTSSTAGISMSLNSNLETNKLLDDIVRKQRAVSFKVQDMNSGVLTSISNDHSDSEEYFHSIPSMQIDDSRLVVLTTEHFITKVEQTTGNSMIYCKKYPFTSLFLIGGQSDHYAAHGFILLTCFV
jgi:hypothetical protein